MDRANALSDFADLLTNASQRKQPLSELFPNGYDTFYHDLIDVLPVYSIESKQRKWKHKRIEYTIIAFVCLLLVSIVALWSHGYLYLWIKGIAYPAGNLNAYHYSYTTDQTEYSLTVNLSDPESNVGKILYDDGECSITVDKIDFVGIGGGGYRIQFRSHDTYSIDSARLVSGLSHYNTIERYFSYEMTAKIKVEYNGKTYLGGIMGLSGLNYKDGDDFSFYIFPNEAYTNKEIPLSDAGNVTLTITDLCVNRWNRK